MYEESQVIIHIVWSAIIIHFYSFILAEIPNILLRRYDYILTTSWCKPIISLFLHITRCQLYHSLVGSFISSWWIQVKCNPDLVVEISNTLKANFFKHKLVATTTGHNVWFTRSFCFYNTCILSPMYFQTIPKLCMKGVVIWENRAAWEGKIN